MTIESGDTVTVTFTGRAVGNLTDPYGGDTVVIVTVDGVSNNWRAVVPLSTVTKMEEE